jgi:CMP-N-acetylneuraminic acid synthetase
VKIFIPIKENSQRVYRKNFRVLNGEPLFKHGLLKYSDFEVYVDSDSDEIIKSITDDKRLSNVVVYRRCDELLGDKVSVCDLIESFINRFGIQDPVIQTHVTSPFLTGELLRDAYSFMGVHDSVVSCNTYNSRFWRKENYGFCPLNHNPTKLEQTQDLPTLYEENSAFYIFNPDVIMKAGNRIGKNPHFFPIGYPFNFDIDTEDDWKQIKKILENK